MSEEHAVRLVVSDVDGTLLTNDRVLTPRAIRAVQALREAGIDFTLASSRPPRGMAQFVKPLGLTLPLAGLNGGILVNTDLSLIEKHELRPEAAHAVVELLEAQGLHVWIYTGEDWFVPKADGPHVDRESWILGFKPTVAPSYDKAQVERAVKIVGVSDDPELVSAGEAALAAQLEGRVEAARSEPHFIDVTSSQSNKGVAIAAFARLMNLQPSQIATIGDMPNDVLMFKKSGVSTAMGNASPQVQTQADNVTASNEADGFAKAVEALVRLQQQGRGGSTLDADAAAALGSPTRR